MRRKVILTILAFTVLRLLTASLLELGNDESYYWLYSQQLQWNYFDHPPLVALGIRFFTFNLALDHQEVFVRLGSVLGCAFSSWFMYKAVSLISNERAGWLTVVLYNVSFYAAVVAGILVMPDSPQMLCWTFCLWMIARISIKERDRWAWIALGIAAGLCIMSKVHGVFLWTGLGAYILIKKRKWLQFPEVYASLLLTVIIASPILWWNWQYDFITWRFHSERVNITEQLTEKDSFWQEMLGQILVNNPVNFILILLALYSMYKNRLLRSPALSVYNYIALPMALCLIFISFFRDIWPHWSGPAYTSLLPVTAIWLAQQKSNAMPLRWATAIFLIFIIAWPLTIHLYPGTFGSKRGNDLGKGDFTLDKYGWKEAGEKFREIYYEDIAEGNMPKETPLVCSKWWGSHMEYYFCNAGEIPVIGLGQIGQLHQYAWLNKERQEEVDMSSAYCIVSSIENGETPSINLYREYYDRVDSIATIKVYRGSIPVQCFYVYRLSGWRHKEIPVPYENPKLRQYFTIK
jgi:hypothetical protein